MIELLNCEVPEARAAATKQLRYWFAEIPNAVELLRKLANDEDTIVRLEAAIAASYIGTEEALVAMLDTLKHPHDSHLSYAIRTSLGSRTLRPIWENNEELNAAQPELKEFLAAFEKSQKVKSTKRSAQDSDFDSQKRRQNGQDWLRERANALHHRKV